MESLKKDILNGGNRLPLRGNMVIVQEQTHFSVAWRDRIIGDQIRQVTYGENAYYSCKMGALFHFWCFLLRKGLAPYCPLCCVSHESQGSKNFSDLFVQRKILCTHWLSLCPFISQKIVYLQSACFFYFSIPNIDGGILPKWDVGKGGMMQFK